MPLCCCRPRCQSKECQPELRTQYGTAHTQKHHDSDKTHTVTHTRILYTQFPIKITQTQEQKIHVLVGMSGGPDMLLVIRFFKGEKLKHTLKKAVNCFKV